MAATILGANACLMAVDLAGAEPTKPWVSTPACLARMRYDLPQDVARQATSE
jgi:hypothetical protein